MVRAEKGEGHRRPAFLEKNISIAVPHFGVGSTGCVGWGEGTISELAPFGTPFFQEKCSRFWEPENASPER